MLNLKKQMWKKKWVINKMREICSHLSYIISKITLLLFCCQLFSALYRFVTTLTSNIFFVPRGFDDPTCLIFEKTMTMKKLKKLDDKNFRHVRRAINIKKWKLCWLLNGLLVLYNALSLTLYIFMAGKPFWKHLINSFKELIFQVSIMCETVWTT